MKTFVSEEQRYNYPLTPQSVVIDAGAYEGAWSREMCRRYDCRVVALEPVEKFFINTESALAEFPKATVFNYGLGAEGRFEDFHVQNNSTGLFASSTTIEEVEIKSVDWLLMTLASWKFLPVDVLKLNVEGMEFEIMDKILDAGMSSNFRHLQIQFHSVIPDAVARRDNIRERLRDTHLESYCDPFVWEGWTLK